MPAYLTLPPSSANRPLLVPGRNQYLFGSSNATHSPTLLNITNISATVNTVTISATITAGDVPTTAQLLTVQNASNAGINAIGATVTAVTGYNTGDNSTGTIAYTVNAVGTIGSVAGSGQVVMPVPETADVCQNGASLQVTMPFNDPRIDQSRTVVGQVSFPSLPTTATVTLQGSDDDVTYYDVATVASVVAGVQSGGILQVQNTAARFYRFNVSSVAGGTLPTIVAKLSA